MKLHSDPRVNPQVRRAYTEVKLSKVEDVMEEAKQALLGKQAEEGYWCYEFEADCTISSEYILMMHYLGEVDRALEVKLARYIRSKQNEQGGWPLYYGGMTNLSCTVKAYYALKLAGDDIEEPHMLKAKRTILGLGGAAKANVFTRIMLAMFEQVPWRAVPFIPAEIMFLPRWFPFHIYKVASWSRTVMVPLFVLYSLRAKAVNPTQTNIQELFVVEPTKVRSYFKIRSPLNLAILLVERIAFRLERFIPKSIRKRALAKAEAWFIARLNGINGINGIFPAMVNAYEALLLLGYDKDHELVKTARAAIDNLLVIREDDAYCQPCLSPTWDTALAICALQETDDPSIQPALDKACSWLLDKQITKAYGDWMEIRPHLSGGGWAFQFENVYYPDLDDTSVVAYSIDREGISEYNSAISKAAYWLKGMQSRNGGFGAYDADNSHYYLNEIPFADHGALLDPPTADVSARCVMLFGRLLPRDNQLKNCMDACLSYLFDEQEEDGSWFGRWGTNYIYGTWSVLIALESAGVSSHDHRVRRAVDWLINKQRPDGSWGEDNDSYEDMDMKGRAYTGSSCQTAWALLGLMSAGEVRSEAVKRGINYLLSRWELEGTWMQEEFNAPGFPRVFYLTYHGYYHYFPLWALARYRNEMTNRVVRKPLNKTELNLRQ